MSRERNHFSIKPTCYLVEFIPDGIEVLLDGVAAVGDTSHADLDIGVTLALDHAPHEVVLGYQVLGLHQMDTQHSLWVEQGWGMLL